MADYKQVTEQVKARKRKTQKKTFVSEGGDDQLTQQLAAARGAVANQTKTYIIAGGIQDALTDIANGNFGEAGDNAIALLNASITAPLEVEVELMQESFSPKNLLPPSPPLSS